MTIGMIAIAAISFRHSVTLARSSNSIQLSRLTIKSSTAVTTIKSENGTGRARSAWEIAKTTALARKNASA